MKFKAMMILVALLVAVVGHADDAVTTGQVEISAIELYAEEIAEDYRRYCYGVGSSLAYFATKEEEDGTGIHFDGISELTQAADRWIKHCGPYLVEEQGKAAGK